MKDFILARGKEASTWRGLVALLTAVGVSISPEQGEAIVALGLATGLLISIGTNAFPGIALRTQKDDPILGSKKRHPSLSAHAHDGHGDKNEVCQLRPC